MRMTTRSIFILIESAVATIMLSTVALLDFYATNEIGRAHV